MLATHRVCGLRVWGEAKTATLSVQCHTKALQKETYRDRGADERSRNKLCTTDVDGRYANRDVVDLLVGENFGGEPPSRMSQQPTQFSCRVLQPTRLWTNCCLCSLGQWS